jgi:ribosomal protein S12 methylthiotransferase
MSIQRKISKARNRRMIGQQVPVLIEGPSAETELLWQARMAAQAPEIDGVCYVNDFEGAPPQVGQIRTFRITEAHDYDLVGTLTGEAPLAPASPPPNLLQILPAQRPSVSLTR